MEQPPFPIPTMVSWLWRHTGVCTVLTVMAVWVVARAEQSVVVSREVYQVAERSLRVVKRVDPATGRMRIVSSDPDVKSLRDVDRWLDARSRERREVLGCLSPDLVARAGQMRPDDSLDVAVEIRMPHLRYSRRSSTTEAQMRAEALAASMLRPVVSASAIARRHGVRVCEACGHILLCRVRRDALMSMQFDTDIVSVVPVPATVPAGSILTLTSLAESALNPEAHPGDNLGEGTKTAVLESNTGTHVLMTQACVEGAAPLSDRRLIESNYYDMYGTDVTVVSAGIEVASMSMSREGGQSVNSAEMRIIDEFVYRWPCALIVTLAGNNGWQEPVHWQAYNALCVGCAKHREEYRYEFDDFTCTLNPAPAYGSCLGDSVEGCPSDRELPELLAPGSHPYEPAGVYDPTCLWGIDSQDVLCTLPENPDSQYICGTFWDTLLHGGGTSLAAPIANGMAARVISSNPRLFRHKPDAVKMALMLTAHNVEGGHWDPAVDGRDGTGTVSGYDAVAYAVRCTDVSLEDQPAVHGYCTGEGDSSMVEREFQVLVPAEIPVACHLRTVLVWTSTPDMDEGQNYLSDLDIGGFAGDTGTYGSYSLDASVEVFDVSAGDVTPGQTYSFTLYPRQVRIPAGARTDFFYFSLGWTWVRDHADSTLGVAKHSPRRWSAKALRLTADRHGAEAQVFRLHTPEELHDCVFILASLSGRTVSRQPLATVPAGTNAIVVPRSRLPAPGLYVAEVRSRRHAVCARVAVWAGSRP